MVPPPPPPSPPTRSKKAGAYIYDSSSPMSSTTSSPTKRSRANKFPTKLLDMLNAGEDEGGRVVGWTSEGDGILIRDNPTFASDVLPMYFRHSNINSFQRQLLLYGFVRDAAVTNGQAYRHTDDLMFRRDDPDGCLAIKITRPSGASTSTSTSYSSSDSNEPKDAHTKSKPKPKSKLSSVAVPQTHVGGFDMNMPPTAFKTADASRFAPPGDDGTHHAAVQPSESTINTCMGSDTLDAETNRGKKKSKMRSFPGAKAFAALGDNRNGSDAMDLNTNSGIGNGYWDGGKYGESAITSQYSKLFGNPHAGQLAMPLPLRLCRDEDMYYLSERQCYGRRHLIEVFLATYEDVKRRNCLGGNHGIEVNQIGLRCSFCCDIDPQFQPKASICFPRSIKALNAAVTEMLRQHTEKCEYVPSAVKEALASLKANRPKTKPGNTMNETPNEYWIRTCTEAGLVDTEGHNKFGGIQLKHGVEDGTSLYTYIDPDYCYNNEGKGGEANNDIGGSCPRSLSTSPMSASVCTCVSSTSISSGGNSTSGLSPAPDVTDPAAYWSHRYNEFKNYNLEPDGGGGKKSKGKGKGKVTNNVKAKGKSGGNNSSEKKPNERRISPEAIKFLKEWLFANASHPYTSDQQRDELCRQTGLSRLQVKNWLTNSRRRLLRPMLAKLQKEGRVKVEVSKTHNRN